MEKSETNPYLLMLGGLTLIIAAVGFPFYKALLSMTLWNMYLAEYTFEIGYWQMFLLGMLFSTMFKSTHGIDEINYKLKVILGNKHKLGLEESFKLTTLSYAKVTIYFGILCIIYTLI